ncbi:MAG TPA: IclR family transcriptional regulator C-terminal domain-containing protein [Terriglobales bacterium]|nr:IclR family transcriptional regulator C-terminal domain-containing protein [Terriglobales bacterium]
MAASPSLRNIPSFNGARVDRAPASGTGSVQPDPNFMTSLARGLAVIQAFSDRKRHVTISQLSGKTGLSRAAVRRCLYTLRQLGFAGCDDHGRFFLRPRILLLGHSYLSTMPLSTAAQPILEHLGHLLHESASVATLDDQDIIYVARVHVTRVMGIELGVGSRLPSFCTSLGRVLLAHLEPDDMEAYLSRARFTRYTEHTIVSADTLRQVLGLVRGSGYSIVDQELEIGLRSMAVPIITANGKAVAALNVGAHAQRVSIQQLESKFLPHLRAAAQELGSMLR